MPLFFSDETEKLWFVSDRGHATWSNFDRQQCFGFESTDGIYFLNEEEERDKKNLSFHTVLAFRLHWKESLPRSLLCLGFCVDTRIKPRSTIRHRRPPIHVTIYIPKYHQHHFYEHRNLILGVSFSSSCC
mmetsp:Transcript_8735/g.16757  ORF Transcript_8735/g.16757 Transcript_8735/m.16757 type:complete len:130 (-) Transcript_8735:49-438(-)